MALFAGVEAVTVGKPGSIVQVKEAGVGSMLLALSTARTSNVCEPALKPA